MVILRVGRGDVDDRVHVALARAEGRKRGMGVMKAMRMGIGRWMS